MQAAMKELRSLRQEEQTMVALASRISDQLNRLKVEELALQNLIRQQNQDENDMKEYTAIQVQEAESDEENLKPLDLAVAPVMQPGQEEEEEEEDESEEHEDLAQYVESLTEKSKSKQ